MTNTPVNTEILLSELKGLLKKKLPSLESRIVGLDWGDLCNVSEHVLHSTYTICSKKRGKCRKTDRPVPEHNPLVFHPLSYAAQKKPRPRRPPGTCRGLVNVPGIPRPEVEVELFVLPHLGPDLRLGLGPISHGDDRSPRVMKEPAGPDPARVVTRLPSPVGNWVPPVQLPHRHPTPSTPRVTPPPPRTRLMSGDSEPLFLRSFQPLQEASRYRTPATGQGG
ncbi:hypothetical protein SKAU_G00257450 [Synaphobranchus kaupii]|uniref:Uncharacterized protein n=1 Tax=Synaphobranchus kaupii TaxID=118154 RepID=A0A9Q1ISG9_SYNKA|nr:hypothetical protein SKAU_G00257450 [Synaphobranchus kaupii]